MNFHTFSRIYTIRRAEPTIFTRETASDLTSYCPMKLIIATVPGVIFGIPLWLQTHASESSKALVLVLDECTNLESN